MAQIKKVGDKYFVEFFGNGLRFEKFAGNDLETANKIRKQIEESLQNQHELYRDRFLELDVFFTEYLEFAKKEYPWKTVKRLNTLSGHFQEFIAQQRPDVVFIQQVTPRVIDEYARVCNPKRVNFTIFLLAFIFEYGIKKNYINDNPTVHFRWLKAAWRGKLFDDLAPKMDRLIEGIIKQKEREKKGLAFSSCLVQETMDIVELKSPLGLPPLNYAQLRRLIILNLLAKKIALTKIYQILVLDDIAQLCVFIPLTIV